MQIKSQESTISVKTEDKILYSKVDKLFEAYKHFVKEYANDNKTKVLEEIRRYAKVFRKAFNPDVVNNEIKAGMGIVRINTIIFALDTTTLIPYVLFIEYNMDNLSVKNELYDFVETYIMRRFICKETTKNYNQLFTDRLIHNKILSKQDFWDFLNK